VCVCVCVFLRSRERRDGGPIGYYVVRAPNPFFFFGRNDSAHAVVIQIYYYSICRDVLFVSRMGTSTVSIYIYIYTRTDACCLYNTPQSGSRGNYGNYADGRSYRPSSDRSTSKLRTLLLSAYCREKV